MSQYRAPNGELIIGTAESVLCTASISGIDDGGFPQYAGDTTVHWDTQEGTNKDHIIFVCDSGEEWKFEQLTKVEEPLAVSDTPAE